MKYANIVKSLKKANFNSLKEKILCINMFKVH